MEDTVKSPDSLCSVISKVETFLKSSDKVMVITGMIGTGIEQLPTALVEKTRRSTRNVTTLAPNRRIASHYEREASSIYGHIYSGNPDLESDQENCVVYPVRHNRDAEDQLYIIGHAHLISDSIFKIDNLRYGSGRVLRDFLEFSIPQERSERKVIFLGDPFQLTRGKPSESAVCNERLQAITDFPVNPENQIHLSDILPHMENNLFVANCLKLAKSIEENSFNQLQIDTDNLQIIEASFERVSMERILRDRFSKDLVNTKYIAFSHSENNKVNHWIRKQILKYPEKEEICKGDIVHIHNRLSFELEGEDNLKQGIEQCTYVPSGSFVKIIEVKPCEQITQQLEGREKPVIVEFLRVRARLIDSCKETPEFLCLKSYLHAEKPEVHKDTLLALQAYVEQKWKEKDQESNSQTLKIEKAKFLRNDLHLNAAQLRFGYALTLHRAQGSQFKTVVGNADTGQGQTNESYFRWVYTLFSVVQEKIILFNTPCITPLCKTSWETRRGELRESAYPNRIAFDPHNEAGDVDIPGFSIPEKPLRNLHLKIQNTLRIEGISIDSRDSHQYQVIYCFNKDGNSGTSCSLRIYYNREYEVTRIQEVRSDPSEFADQVRSFITSNLHVENNLQKKIFDYIKEKLDLSGVSIQSIEHHQFQETYYLQLRPDAVKLKIWYDKDGFVTKISPAQYTSSGILEQVRQSLGIK